MRIALLAPANVVHTVRWANALVERGRRVHLLSCHDPSDRLHPEVEYERLPGLPPLGYFTAAPRLRRRLRESPPDVLSSHFASGYGTLARLAGFHPAVLSVWGSDVYLFPERSPLHRWWLVGNLRAADRICSTSRAMAGRVAELGPGPDRVDVTPFGIETDVFAPRESSGPRETITIGTVKTLEPRYGIDILVRSFARLRDSLRDEAPELAGRLRLLVVGGGRDRSELERLASGLRLDDVTRFTGPVPHEEVPEHLGRLDVYVAASRSESFGVAVLEASACGIPVVVSDVGGLPEVVVDGETGVVFPGEDVDALAGVLRRLVGDEAERRRMGDAGRAHVEARYAWSRCVDVFDGILAAAGGRA